MIKKILYEGPEEGFYTRVVFDKLLTNPPAMEEKFGERLEVLKETLARDNLFYYFPCLESALEYEKTDPIVKVRIFSESEERAEILAGLITNKRAITI